MEKITEQKDIFGQALTDYLNHHGSPLFIETSYGETEEMPVDVFFRKPKEFPALEHYALKLCTGSILDIGSGAGSHALYLQAKGRDISALEISPLAAWIQKTRGVKNIIEADIFTYSGKRFDTLLLLMNGIGIAGTTSGLDKLLIHLKKLLKPGGSVIFDSSDIAYLYEEHPWPEGKYYGEISYRYVYKGRKGPWFHWLYIDQDSMFKIAGENGYQMQVMAEDESGQYLGRLTLEQL